MIVTCAQCATKNRLPPLPKGKARCGKCKHEFTIKELSGAVGESPAQFNLDREADIDWRDEELLDIVDDQPVFRCCDKTVCGWDGYEDELDGGRCPECNGPCRKDTR